MAAAIISITHPKLLTPDEFKALAGSELYSSMIRNKSYVQIEGAAGNVYSTS